MAQPRHPIIRLRAIFLAAGLALTAEHALAQAARYDEAPPVTYPSAMDKATLSAWLHKETDIDPDAVVAITPDTVLSILQSRVVDGAMAVIVRGEVVTAEAAAREKVASWHATVQVDCARGRVRQGVTTGYAARNLLFDGGPIRPADADWSKPLPGDPLDQVRRAACEKDFRGPLTSGEGVPTMEAPPAVEPPPPPPKPEAPKPAPKPAPAPRAEPPKPAPRPAPPAAPHTPAAAPAPAPVAAAPRTGAAKVSVQIAAAGSEAEATSLLTRLKTRQAQAMAGLDTRIVGAQVGGKTVYRALVVGFADQAAAIAFCQALKAANQACFVRADLG